MKYPPDLIIVVYFFNDATYRGTAAQLTRPIHREAAGVSSGRFVLLNYLRYRIARKAVSRHTIEDYRQAYFTGKGGITQTGLWEKCKESMVAESLWVSIENSHLNERGHEIAAASLTEYLLESDLLPYQALP